MKLSEGQTRVLELVWGGHNVFMTGSGGTGKSTLIREIHRQAELSGKKIQVAALTGCAAVLLKCHARTIHSFAGIGIGTGTIEENVERVSKNYMRSKNWKQIDILVIDEVSMMSKKLFEMLDAVARRVRRSEKPFGGLQIIFSGDFYQIRPIGNDNEPDTMAFCFESPLWQKTFGSNQIILEKIFRQRDPVYAEILNQIREGTITDDALKILMEQTDKERTDFRPTQLFPKRRQVDEVNTRELMRLPHDTAHEYIMKDELNLPMTKKDADRRVRFSKQDIENELLLLKKNLICDPKIHLRKGSQIMYIVNKEYNESYLCNGSQGIVRDFTVSGHPIVDFVGDNDDLKNVIIEPHVWPSENIPGIGVSQIPLILAWAMTIHKAQGSTLEMAEVDAGDNIFECGQTYVALSRLKNLNGLYLKSFDPRSVYINPTVKEFYDGLRRREKNETESKEIDVK